MPFLVLYLYCYLSLIKTIKHLLWISFSHGPRRKKLNSVMFLSEIELGRISDFCPWTLGPKVQCQLHQPQVDNFPWHRPSRSPGPAGWSLRDYESTSEGPALLQHGLSWPQAGASLRRQGPRSSGTGTHLTSTLRGGPPQTPPWYGSHSSWWLAECSLFPLYSRPVEDDFCYRGWSSRTENCLLWHLQWKKVLIL